MSFLPAARQLRSTAKGVFRRLGSRLGMLHWPSSPLRSRFLRVLRDDNQRRNFREQEAAAVRLESMPTRLHLQTTGKCNFRCIMCWREQPGRMGPRPSSCMDPALLRRVAHEGFAYAMSVNLSCSGEPLLASNLDESLELAKRYDVPLNITTNGSLLGRPGMLEKLVPRLGHLTLSLDAATPKTLESIRPGARFHEIVAAMARCSEMRNALAERTGRRPTLSFGVVLMRRNIAELPDLVRLAKRLEVERRGRLAPGRTLFGHGGRIAAQLSRVVRPLPRGDAGRGGVAAAESVAALGTGAAGRFGRPAGRRGRRECRPADGGARRRRRATRRRKNRSSAGARADRAPFAAASLTRACSFKPTAALRLVAIPTRRCRSWETCGSDQSARSGIARPISSCERASARETSRTTAAAVTSSPSKRTCPTAAC